jgi:hypothetical protein
MRAQIRKSLEWRAEIKQYILAHNGVTLEQIAIALNMSDTPVRTHTKILRADKEVEKLKNPNRMANGGSMPALWGAPGFDPVFPKPPEVPEGCNKRTDPTAGLADDFAGRKLTRAEQMGVRSDPLALPRAFFGGVRT